MNTQNSRDVENLGQTEPTPGGPAAVDPPSSDESVVIDGALPPPTADTATAGSDDDPVLVGISFDRRVRAQEFLLAVSRLQQDGALQLADAVIVQKQDDGSTSVTETVDVTPGRAALSGALWTGLLGLIVGGPVGWLAGLGVGAGAGAATAKFVDLGIPDDWIDWFKDAVRPGTATVIVLLDDLNLSALEREAARFTGAELLHTTLPAAAWSELRDAFDGR